MRASEIVQKFISALKQPQWEMVFSTLSNDFTANGWTPQLLGKNEWLVINQPLATAMPNWSFGSNRWRERENQSAETPLSAPSTGPDWVTFIAEISLRDLHALER